MVYEALEESLDTVNEPAVLKVIVGPVTTALTPVLAVTPLCTPTPAQAVAPDTVKAKVSLLVKLEGTSHLIATVLIVPLGITKAVVRVNVPSLASVRL